MNIGKYLSDTDCYGHLTLLLSEKMKNTLSCIDCACAITFFPMFLTQGHNRNLLKSYFILNAYRATMPELVNIFLIIGGLV